MMKFQVIGAINWMISTAILFASPILTFALPQTHVWYGYLFVLAGLSVVMVIDLWNSDSTMRNVAVLDKAGYTRTKTWGYVLTNFSAFQLPGMMLAMYGVEYDTDWNIPTWDSFSKEYVFCALAMVLSTDALSFVVHKFLHEQIPRIHLFHHCCIHSSQTTNFCFHPLDAVLEFSAPTLALFCMSKYLIIKDDDACSWMFALTSGMAYAFYGSIHDEWLASAHTKHHRGCATGYFSYIHYFYGDATKESVRKHLPKELSGQDALKQTLS